MIYKVVIDATKALNALKKMGVQESVKKENFFFVEAENPDGACHAAIEKLEDKILQEKINDEVVDFLEDSHRTLDSYVKELKDKDYLWGTDYLPHDATHKDFKHGRSTEEMLRTMGRNPFVLSRADVEQGIIKTRMTFPKMYFDKNKTKELLNHIKRYRRTINSAGEPSSPLHDNHSHAADALRYLAMSVDLMTNDDWATLPKQNLEWVV